MWANGIGAMDSGVVKTDEDILTFDASDASLERAAVVSPGQAITIGVCTHWYACNWPL